MATDDGQLGNGAPNRDPITNEPGAHPVGTGLGAAGGAIAGAAAGALAGPAGMVAGLLTGAVVGAMGGKAAAENVNPTMEDAYWRENYSKEAYYDAGRPYDDYGPAYELGWSVRAQRDADFTAVEPALAAEWEARRGTSSLAWPEARPATEAAWRRADRTYYGVPVTDDDDGILDPASNGRDAPPTKARS
ncbi:hypothetical protein [Variovorax sp. KK3]|uniref:hypothetical protein n=1 Tax=Variovorax sp. KK3 TaxID=1855728 RepID=UPI00097CB3F5